MIGEAIWSRVRGARSDPGGLVERIRRTAPGALAQGMAAMLFLVRFLPGIHWPTRVRWYDSWGYARFDIANYPELLDFLGRAPRPWPVPALYALAGDDGGRLALQLLLSSLAWAGLLWAVASCVRSQGAAVVGGVLIGWLSFSEPARGWDAMLFAEGPTIALSIALVAALIRFLGTPTLRLGVAVGLVSGVLATMRPPLIPALLLLALAAAWRSRSAPRRPIAVGLALFVLLLVYLVGTHANQQQAFRAFERDFHFKQVPSTQEDETWMSLLYARYLNDPAMRRWLEDQGAPPLEPGMVPMEGSDNLVNWSRSFRTAYFSSEAWQGWYRDNGGTALFFTIPLRTPLTQLRLFADAVPFILWSGWGEPHYIGVQPGPPEPPIRIFFTRIGVYPADLLILGLATLGLLWVTRAVPEPWTPVGRVGALTTAGAVIVVFAAWLLCGTELIRHAVPGPLLLRIGFILIALETLDRALRHRRRPAISAETA